MQQQQQQMQTASTTGEQKEAAAGDAPPKQVALAMERLGQAARLIADIRLGADRFLEAVLSAADPRYPDPDKTLIIITKADVSMRQHFQDLRSLGRQLEETGVLNPSLRSRSDFWGLHMPLVSPDSTVVAYAWKRQLAGQAGASAVDRTRLALKAFKEQKKRYFPHLEDESGGHRTGTDFETSKKHCTTLGLADVQRESPSESRTLSDILTRFENESPNVKIFTYQRLDWFKRASSLSLASSVGVDQHNLKHRMGSLGSTSMEQVAVIELFVPFVFRAVLALHPAGSLNPAALAFFSPEEGGNYVHSRGSSVYNVFKRITEHADKALQYFQCVQNEDTLESLLHWIYGYHTLFSKVCSKCRRLIAMDRSYGLPLPPVYHPYQHSSAVPSSGQSTSLNKALNSDQALAYHFGCFSDEL